MTQLPQPYLDFQQKYADVWQAYDQLGAAVHAAGPLDEKNRALVIGAQREGGCMPTFVN